MQFSCKARSPGQALRLSYNVLQASGARISKPITSPARRGRTLFNLQNDDGPDPKRPPAFEGVKIAIMDAS